jgi:hypothetical protein
MRRVELSAGEWSVSAFLASGFMDRFLGKFRIAPGAVVVLPVRSVHSFGQREPIELVAVDRQMRVVATCTLLPNRVSHLPAARLIVELPAGSAVPRVDDRLVMTDG